MQSLNQKLETACAALVSAVAEGIQVQKGLTNFTKTLPSITVASTGGMEYPQGSGNFTITLTCEVRTNADDFNVEEHAIVCDEILAPVMSDDLANELSAAAPDFHAFGISNRQCRQAVDDRSYVTELTFDVYCCGQEIALT